MAGCSSPAFPFAVIRRIKSYGFGPMATHTSTATDGNCILYVGLQMCGVKEAEAKASAGAPDHEIEVTPEMIEAGFIGLLLFRVGEFYPHSESEIRRERLARMVQRLAPTSTCDG